MPEKKVTTATLAGAIVTILIWILGLAGVHMPAEVAAAITTILTALAGYLTPHGHPRDPDPSPGAPGAS